MFDYLCHRVKPTKSSVQMMFDKELPEILSLIKGNSPDDDSARLCHDIDRLSMSLGKAIRASGTSFVDTYKDSYPDVPEELWSLFRVWSVVAILVVLRLVERELEAEDLAKNLGILDP